MKSFLIDKSLSSRGVVSSLAEFNASFIRFKRREFWKGACTGAAALFSLLWIADMIKPL